VATEFAALNDFPHLESSLEKLTRVAPESPEAWYDLAALRAQAGKPKEVIEPLKRAVTLSSQRLRADPKARDLLTEVKKDGRFAATRAMPEFSSITN